MLLLEMYPMIHQIDPHDPRNRACCMGTSFHDGSETGT